MRFQNMNNYSNESYQKSNQRSIRNDRNAKFLALAMNNVVFYLESSANI